MRGRLIAVFRALAAVFVVNLTMQAATITLTVPAGCSKGAVMAPAPSSASALVQRIRGRRRLSSPQAACARAVAGLAPAPASPEAEEDLPVLSRGRAAPDHPPV